MAKFKTRKTENLGVHRVGPYGGIPKFRHTTNIHSYKVLGGKRPLHQSVHSVERTGTWHRPGPIKAPFVGSGTDHQKVINTHAHVFSGRKLAGIGIGAAGTGALAYEGYKHRAQIKQKVSAFEASIKNHTNQARSRLRH